MTKPDYQQQRVEAIERQLKKWPNWERYTAKELARAVLEAADAVPRPTQPDVMSAEELHKKLSYEALATAKGPSGFREAEIDWDNFLRIIKDYEDAIRQSERDKVKRLVESARLASKLWDQLQQMYDTQDTKEWKKSRSSRPRDVFESYIDALVEMANEALTNYESENSHD